MMDRTGTLSFGVLGVGNTVAVPTAMIAPGTLALLTNDRTELEWR